MDRSILHCHQTDRAGARKELEEAADHARNTKEALDLIQTLVTVGEETKSEPEFIPVLLSRVATGAKVIQLWDQAQSLFYRNSAQDQFQVCTLGLGVMLVRPVKGVPGFALAAGLSGLRPQPLPTLSVNPNLRQDAAAFLAPVCTPFPEWIDYLDILTTLPSIHGRVVQPNLSNGSSPVRGALVSLLGPTIASCRTSVDGTFWFQKLGLQEINGVPQTARYTISVSRNGSTISKQSTLDVTSEISLPDFHFYY